MELLFGVSSTILQVRREGMLSERYKTSPVPPSWVQGDMERKSLVFIEQAQSRRLSQPDSIKRTKGEGGGEETTIAQGKGRKARKLVYTERGGPGFVKERRKGGNLKELVYPFRVKRRKKLPLMRYSREITPKR